MKPRLFTILIIITAISLLGVVFTQIFWVNNAIRMKEEHFSQSVRIAMKSVLNHLVESNTDSTLKRMCMPAPCYQNKAELLDVIDPQLFDSLVQAELGCMQIYKGYEYAIYNRRTEKFMLGNYHHYRKEILESEHQQSIRAVFSRGDFYFAFYFPHEQGYVLGHMLKWMILSALFTLVVIFSFWFTIVTMIRQKKLSEMKSDFINNMTHEFKTPIATIQLASEMLMKPEVNQSSEKTMKYASVVYNENYRLQNQVEQVLQMAILDKGGHELRMQETDLHRIILRTVENFEIKAHEKSADIQLHLMAENPVILGDRMHLSNVFANLLDNALKYSVSKPLIEISSRMASNGVTIVIKDNGIGIANENQPLVFKNLYRVHTGDLHDVKGFGLGLYYVKQMVEKHKGKVILRSQLGKGSEFEVFLPLNSIQKES